MAKLSLKIKATNFRLINNSVFVTVLGEGKEAVARITKNKFEDWLSSSEVHTWCFKNSQDVADYWEYAENINDTSALSDLTEYILANSIPLFVEENDGKFYYSENLQKKVFASNFDARQMSVALSITGYKTDVKSKPAVNTLLFDEINMGIWNDTSSATTGKAELA